MMRTPYFVISEEKLKDNLSGFQRALSTFWPNSEIAYSFKTNSLPWLLEWLRTAGGVMAEVVSDEEYQLAELCGYPNSRIVFNGPVKGEEQFRKAIEGGSYINIDSRGDLELLKKYRKFVRNGQVGVRVNVDTGIFSENDIGYKEEGFRFGFSAENGEFEKALQVISETCDTHRVGLHLHCNSVTRAVGVYKMIARYASKLIMQYDLEPAFIDMGGGFFGGMEGKPVPEDYISVIRQELEKVVDINRTKLIIEPGTAIIGSTTDLYTSVIDVKDTNKTRIVTTDGSRILIDPTWIKKMYRYSLIMDIKVPGGRRRNIKKQVICGYTCMDRDRIMCVENGDELDIGDRIVYHMVGAYTMTLSSMFIRYLPDVYVKNASGSVKVRNAISAEDFYKIHTQLQ